MEKTLETNLNSFGKKVRKRRFSFISKKLKLLENEMYLSMSSEENRKNRSAIVLIQKILELVIRAGSEGIVKSQIYADLKLKSTVDEKYLEQMVQADYISIREEDWGERVRNKVYITDKGKKRFEWFLTLSKELDL
jgi:predicted transcriptional regulator